MVRLLWNVNVVYFIVHTHVHMCVWYSGLKFGLQIHSFAFRRQTDAHSIHPGKRERKKELERKEEKKKKLLFWTEMR